eukprot:TRINITY_DN4948_c0_g1_i1.p1 TRINITY_DN4948_c0_g1~~TRINITY_DN4948_c0_g1_i1.p1  ORF type:complete len:402 (+),score=89.63 TRINITY_DN4948_c0_g1_i1:65-1270(+)
MDSPIEIKQEYKFCLDCGKRIKIGSLEKHTKKSCPKMICDCVGKKYGCTQNQARREEILIHQLNCEKSKLYFKRKEKMQRIKTENERLRQIIKKERNTINMGEECQDNLNKEILSLKEIIDNLIHENDSLKKEMESLKQYTEGKYNKKKGDKKTKNKEKRFSLRSDTSSSSSKSNSPKSNSKDNSPKSSPREINFNVIPQPSNHQFDFVEEIQEQLKCVVVGDGTVGKTSLILSFNESKFPVEHVPTILDNFRKDIIIDGKKINLLIYDTAGQEEYKRLRELSYPGTDVFILCYSTISVASFENIRTKWYPEVNHSCPNAKIIIVGTKQDLKDKNKNLYDCPKDKDIVKLSEEIGACCNLKCSALTQVGTHDVFSETAKAALSSMSQHEIVIKKKDHCFIF